MKNERFKQICHFTAGLLLIPIAYKLIEKTMFVHCAAFFSAGLLFLAISGGLSFLERHVLFFVKLAYLLESIALLFAGYVFYDINESHLMQVVYVFMGLMYGGLFLYFLTGRDNRAHHKRHRHRHSKHKQQDQ